MDRPQHYREGFITAFYGKTRTSKAFVHLRLPKSPSFHLPSQSSLQHTSILSIKVRRRNRFTSLNVLETWTSHEHSRTRSRQTQSRTGYPVPPTSCESYSFFLMKSAVPNRYTAHTNDFSSVATIPRYPDAQTLANPFFASLSKIRSKSIRYVKKLNGKNTQN